MKFSHYQVIPWHRRLIHWVLLYTRLQTAHLKLQSLLVYLPKEIHWCVLPLQLLCHEHSICFQKHRDILYLLKFLQLIIFHFTNGLKLLTIADTAIAGKPVSLDNRIIALNWAKRVIFPLAVPAIWQHCFFSI